MKRNIRKLKQILVTSTLILGMLTISGNASQAALQANATTHAAGKTYTGAALIQSIRQMETAGQTMGLTETLKTDLTSNTSNNIDVHMMRTTEYGAMAILSASGFGYSGKLADAPVKSTTGNVTGVYVMGTRWEWTAGVCDATTVGKNARYYDLYKINDQTSAKVGDALGLDTYTTNPGCSGWHDASNRNWLGSTSYGFVRGYYGMFPFQGYNQSSCNWASSTNCGRGVAVVGSGL